MQGNKHLNNLRNDRRLRRRILIAALLIVLLVLQYILWFRQGGIVSVVKLRHSVHAQQQQNAKLAASNEVLRAEVKDLKHGEAAVEEHARTDLGMVKRGETYYQVIDDDD